MWERVEVQRVVVLSVLGWLLAGAYLQDPLWLVLARAGAVTAWAFLLGWSFTVARAWLPWARVALGAGLAGACAMAAGGSAGSLVDVLLVAAAVLGATELAVRRAAARAQVSA